MILHQPVMVEAVVRYIVLPHYKVYIDMTVGGGGHAFHILRNSPEGAMLIGIDRDESALTLAAQTLKPAFEGRFRLFVGLFSELGEIMSEAGITSADAFFFDLGLGTYQLASPERGFSYSADGPLDMRMGPGTLTAYDVVNSYSRRELERVLKRLGEERFASRIARAIERVRAKRAITRTGELARIVRDVIPSRFAVKSLARVFQAIRIEVNSELSELRAGLKYATGYLRPGGRIAVISYHSLEDRIVKEWLRDNRTVLTPITPKPVRPSAEEIRANRKARSAKLRVAEKKRAEEIEK